MASSDSSRRSYPGTPSLHPDSLRDLALFGALSDGILEHLAASLKVREFGPGELVFREGDPARELFVVLEGEAEVMKRSRSGRDMRVAVLGPSDVFGEMSLIDLQPRSATVRAISPGRLLVFSNEDLEAVYRLDLKAYALLVLNIARGISRRLRVADGLIAEFSARLLDEYMAFKGG